MKMLYYFKHQTTYSDLDFFENRLRVLLKSNFLEKISIHFSPSGELKFCFASSNLKLHLKFLEIHFRFSEKMKFKNLAMSVWVEARELKFCMHML
jgi:hypothetical protein